ncbi:hypothetical protein [Paraburkholderia atlantica]|uniref:hypothetical protein n=1 Tax=Paraburkholderia atlantica TaxID=2654982 RepID=UPI001612235F|nr:hypothetical protein [Paraburkholderia atlantica]MBB5509604.1 hypothetical protein [Paraburkholderia atlantica]
MFTLFQAKPKITAVTVVSELHGKERIAGCCITFELSSNNYILSEFDSQIRYALYTMDDDSGPQFKIDAVEDDMDGLTKLKFPKLGMPLKFDWEGAGYELQFHIGASGREDIILDGVGLKDFSFDCKEGGTVITKFKAMTHPTAAQQGKIDHMLQLECEISLKQPAEKQKRFD